MAIVRLTTLTEFKKLLGEENADNYTTPLVGSAADDYLLTKIDAASELIAASLPMHDASTLGDSSLIRECAKFIAGWFLSQERANPPHFAPGCQFAFDFIAKVKSGELYLDQSPRVSDNGPQVQNYEYQPQNYRFPVVLDWIATSPGSYPSDPYHGLWSLNSLSPYFW